MYAMAQPIYKVYLMKWKDAWYKLTPEEQEKLLNKVEQAMKEVGGEFVLLCNSKWCSENWQAWGVEKFPDIEAVQKHTQLLLDLNWYNYDESISYLGTEVTFE
jgi:hypothetical protein